MPFAVLTAALMLSYFFRTALAVVAPDVAGALHLSPGELGTVSAGWFIGIAAAQLPVGIALDRWGPRRTMALVMLAAVAGAALFAAAEGFAAALAGQLLIGIGCGPIFMGGAYVLARWYPPRRFASLSSLLLALGGLGNILAAEPLGYAADAVGWRAVFAATAAATLLTVLAVWWYIGDQPPGEPRPVSRESFGEALRGVLAVIRLRALWPLLPLLAMASAVIFALRSLWGGAYLADTYGLDRVARGEILGWMAIAMVAAAALTGPLATWLGRFRPVGGLAMLGATVALAVLTLAGGTSLAVASACLVAVGFFGNAYGVLMSHGRGFLPARLIGRGVTVLNLCSFIGTALCQVGSGWLVAAGGYPALFGVLAVASLAALGAYALSREPGRSPG